MSIFCCHCDSSIKLFLLDYNCLATIKVVLIFLLGKGGVTQKLILASDESIWRFKVTGF